jgi:hypothetical protein
MPATIVTNDNFIEAETDRYCSEHVAGHPVNTIRHAREPSGPNNQFVITENQDVLYSHALVDTRGGATVTNPAWDNFSVIQIIDENQYTIDVLYPGQSRTLTPDDLTMGSYVFLNMRTGLKGLDAASLAESHAHQDGLKIETRSAIPYEPKGFDKASLDAVRAELISHAREIKDVEKAFGLPEETEPRTRLVAAGLGLANPLRSSLSAGARHAILITRPWRVVPSTGRRRVRVRALESPTRLPAVR